MASREKELMEDTYTKILMVEDNPDHAELMGRALSKYDRSLEIDTIASEERCWAMLEQRKYDAVILDYTLPKVNGLEVLKRIKEKNYKVPVIMVTADGDTRIAVRAMKLGAYDYITKSEDYLITLPIVVQKTIEQYSLFKEKERLDQEVKETKDYLENLLENANDIVGTLDVDYRVTYVNHKIEEYGRKKEELIGKDFLSLLPEKQGMKKLKESMMKGVKKNFKTTFKDKSGETIHLVVSTSPLRDQCGRVAGTFGIARDVTQTIRLEQKQHEMEIELMERHKLSSIGTLIQGIAHNMNSPLTAILGRSQLLAQRLEKRRARLMELSRETQIEGMDEIIQESEKTLEDTRSINENVERLAGIIKNMMYKSRQEQTEELQIININELLKEELAFLEADMFFKHNIKKTYSFDDSIPSIRAIYSDFSQSIVNIVRNALDAMYDSKRKELRVTTKLVENHIRVDISDTGTGIKEEHIPRIFDPFFTTKPSNSSDGSPTGIGLGLHSCYILLKKCGVKIDVKSKPGNTTFSLKIPVQKPKHKRS